MGSSKQAAPSICLEHKCVQNIDAAIALCLCCEGSGLPLVYWQIAISYLVELADMETVSVRHRGHRRSTFWTPIDGHTEQPKDRSSGNDSVETCGHRFQAYAMHGVLTVDMPCLLKSSTAGQCIWPCGDDAQSLDTAACMPAGAAHLGLAAGLGHSFAVPGVVGADPMHLVRGSLCRQVALALLCDDVHQHRPNCLCCLHLYRTRLIFT